MKVYTAHFSHESNSFSPIPTSIENYRDSGLYLPSTGEGEAYLDRDLKNDLALIPILRNRGHEVHIGPIAATTPSAPTLRKDYEFLRDELLSALQACTPLDAVVIFMHGGQMAGGYDDCAGDILGRIRSVVGPGVPIGVELDLHCNISPAMVELADVIIACKEYPHSDFEREGERLVKIIEDTVTGKCRPNMAFAPVPILGHFHTTREPMRALVDQAITLENHADVLAISICHGFGYADSPHTGAGILVVFNNQSKLAASLAAKQAQDLAQALFSIRDDIKATACSMDDAMEIAARHERGTLVMADTTDNPGGGAAGDSTFMLRALLQHRIPNAALALLWDPLVVELCIKAGVNAELPLRIGGKTGPASGDPLDVVATVKTIRRHATQLTFDSATPLGDSICLDIQGVQVIVNSIRQQVFHPQCFTEFGLDPWALDILVVKSAQHFYTEFEQFAARVVYVDAPGTITADFSSLNYKKLTRPIWPIDQPPFEAHGRQWT